MLRNLRFFLWGLVIVVGIGATILSFLPRDRGFGQISFNLIDHDGNPITETAFRGQPTGLFFGFTHCPDVCPATLSEIAVWLDELGPDGKPLQFYFITVDPERDDVTAMKDYATLFSEQVIGITGDADEIKRLEAAFGVYSEKVPTSDGDYTMNHTASLFLLNRNGQFEGTIAYQEPMDMALGKLRRLLGQNAS